MMQSNPAARRKKKKGGCLGPILAVLVVFLLLAGGAGYFAWQKVQSSWEPVSVMLDAEIPVEIQPGSGVALIADELAHNNLIQSRLTFMLYCRLHHVEEKLLAGRYTLRTSQSVPEIVEILMKGQVHLDFFTIPEGYTYHVLDLEPGVFVNADVVNEDDPDAPSLNIQVYLADNYEPGIRLNDVDEETLKEIEDSFTEDNVVEIEYTETGLGTKLMKVTETGDDPDWIAFYSIYEGYEIELTIRSGESGVLTDEIVEKAVKFLTEMDFIKAEEPA